MFQFPFGTMHQLNLDWFLQKFNELVEEWQTAEAGIDNALQAEIDRVEAAMSDLYQARDDAIGAKNDAEAAATAASGSAADALEAEGFAIGEQNGVPVTSGSPYYQANAKYYKVESSTFSYLSEAYAKGTMGGTPVNPGDAGYQDNAKYYKDAADLDASAASGAATSAGADALIAEGNAVGEQNGTPVSSGSPYYENNAKYYAQQTAQDKSDTDTLKDAANNAALRAEGYSSGTQNGTPVSSGSPYYENNAAYFYSQSAGTSGDLAQAMIAGDETTTTLTADYPAGSYIRVQGVLYQTDIDLQSGDTLTVGTNCHVAILGDDVKSLKSTITWDASSYFRNLFQTHFTHSGSGTYPPANNRNAITTPQHFLMPITIIVESGYKFAYQLYDGFTLGSAHLTQASGWITNQVTIPSGSYWCMIVTKTDDSETDNTTQNSLTFIALMSANDVYNKIFNQDQHFSSYVIGPDFVKKEINTSYIGALKYHQSFCIYNNKYYSTDGDNIAEQDSDFTLLRDVALNVGHGNSMQLGNNGTAYISGWDDSNIYAVDLNNLTLIDTITLPVTGYTTSVIDDLNNIAYIFHRTTYPNTIQNYNFIVYNYSTQTIISQKIINAFSSMQAADIIDGKIIILWGMGTLEQPSGMMIYNTAGDVLAEYNLTILRDKEPEGVCIDRTTKEIYISDISKNIFKLSNI